jgi:uncharacterized protein (DUF2236 family)
MHQHPIIRAELVREHVKDLMRDGAQPPVSSSEPERVRRPRLLGRFFRRVRLSLVPPAARQRA